MSNFLSGIASFIKRKTSAKYRFNLQYAEHQWAGLRALEDLPRYSIITGYIHFLYPGNDARILDLGCADGLLQERLLPAGYKYYLGVDISDLAIENARDKQNAKTRFVAGDLDNLAVEGQYDIVVYNESIYYLKDPVAAVKAAFGNMSSGSFLIISCFNRNGKEHSNLWGRLSEILNMVDMTKVNNRNGDSWSIHVYKIKQIG